VPIEQTRTFTTFHDHQETVQIRVYQGDHRQAEDNTLLGQFEFTGFKTGPRSDVKIDVTFEIDADGLVNVTASDQATGKEASTQITLSSGLGDEQIEQMIEQDVAGRVHTAGPPADQAGALPALDDGPDLAASPPKTAPPAQPAAPAPAYDPALENAHDLVDLSETEDAELDLMDDDELDRLAGVAPEPALEPEPELEPDPPGLADDGVISLDDAVEEPPADDDLFDTSGEDLAAPDPDLELADDER
jgi:hypothetical protein